MKTLEAKLNNVGINTLPFSKKTNSSPERRATYRNGVLSKKT
jgi:hypothetical protein